MKKFALIAVLLASGCVSTTTKEIVARQTARCDAYVKKMDAGQTTPVQDKDFIRANRRAWHAHDYSVNGAKLPDDIAATVSSDQPESLVNAGQ